MDKKSILVDLSKPERKSKTKVIEPKVPKKRVVTTTNKWINTNPEKQLDYILQIINKDIRDKRECTFILQQMNQKLSGYKGQDINKNIYSENEFIDMDKVLQLMEKSQNNCFYCKKKVHVLYENVREPMQWTLERIDNSFGHNTTNVEIACLNCNLHRRTMYHERYLFTKELNIIKKLEE